MKAESEKTIYEKEASAILSGKENCFILWGEELYDKRILPYPKKIKAVPGYADFKGNLADVIIVYLDYAKKDFIKTATARYLENEKTIYIALDTFNAIWKYIKKSVNAGIKLHEDECEELSVTKAEDIIDFNSLEAMGGRAHLKNDQLKVIMELSEEEKRLQGKKQSLLDNTQNVFFYSLKGTVFHDKECWRVKEIDPKLFAASKTIPEGMKLCKECRRRMCLRKACSPYVKQMPYVNKFLIRGGITDSQLERIAFDNGLKFKIEKEDELTVKGKEDTWIIKEINENRLQLWHNNYVRTSPEERYIIDGFHDQGINDRDLLGLLKYINGYTFEKHLKAENTAQLSNDIPVLPKERQEDGLHKAGKRRLVDRIRDFIAKIFRGGNNKGIDSMDSNE